MDADMCVFTIEKRCRLLRPGLCLYCFQVGAFALTRTWTVTGNLIASIHAHCYGISTSSLKMWFLNEFSDFLHGVMSLTGPQTFGAILGPITLKSPNIYGMAIDPGIGTVCFGIPKHVYRRAIGSDNALYIAIVLLKFQIHYGQHPTAIYAVVCAESTSVPALISVLC